MKIAYIMQAGVPNLFEQPLSGPAVHVIQVIKELRQQGHFVRLLFRRDNQTWKTDDLESYQRIEIKWFDKGPIHLAERLIRRIQASLNLPYGGFFESFRFALACQHELTGFHILYERMGWVGFGGSLASQMLKIPLILEVNGDHLSELKSLSIAPRGLQKWLSMKLMNFAARSAVHTVATGEGWRQRHIHQWKIKDSDVSVIDNGTNLLNILSRDQLASFQNEHDVQEELKIVFIGGFDPWQGIDKLLKAFAISCSREIRMSLYLIGSGVEEPKLLNLAAELNITSQVHFLGKLAQKEYASILGGADIGISPYCGRVEFSGLKLLDYKAAGLAIIASGIDGQPSIITHKQTGMIVPPCDIEALSDAIVELGHDHQKLKNLGKAARIEAEQIHGWDYTARQLSALFSRFVRDDDKTN